jgi:hypothetical protein
LDVGTGVFVLEGPSATAFIYGQLIVIGNRSSVLSDVAGGSRVNGSANFKGDVTVQSLSFNDTSVRVSSSQLSFRCAARYHSLVLSSGSALFLYSSLSTLFAPGELMTSVVAAASSKICTSISCGRRHAIDLSEIAHRARLVVDDLLIIDSQNRIVELWGSVSDATMKSNRAEVTINGSLVVDGTSTAAASLRLSDSSGSVSLGTDTKNGTWTKEGLLLASAPSRTRVTAESSCTANANGSTTLIGSSVLTSVVSASTLSSPSTTDLTLSGNNIFLRTDPSGSITLGNYSARLSANGTMAFTRLGENAAATPTIAQVSQPIPFSTALVPLIIAAGPASFEDDVRVGGRVYMAASGTITMSGSTQTSLIMNGTAVSLTGSGLGAARLSAAGVFLSEANTSSWTQLTGARRVTAEVQGPPGKNLSDGVRADQDVLIEITNEECVGCSELLCRWRVAAYSGCE